MVQLDNLVNDVPYFAFLFLNIRSIQSPCVVMSKPICKSVVVIPRKESGTCWIASILMALTSGKMRQLVHEAVGPATVDVLNKSKKQRTAHEFIQAWLAVKSDSNMNYIDTHFKPTSDSYLSIVDFLIAVRKETCYQVLPFDPSNPSKISGGQTQEMILNFVEWLKLDFSHIILTRTASGKVALPNIDYDVYGVLHSAQKNRPVNPKILIFSFEQQMHKELKPTYNESEAFELEQVITFNNVSYVCDSMFFSNYNIDENAISPLWNNGGHSLLGITCDNHRYLYDGAIHGYKPCNLFHFDWLEDKHFSLNFDKCSVTEANSAAACYRTRSGSDKWYVYIREDEGQIKYPGRRENAPGPGTHPPIVMDHKISITSLSAFKMAVVGILPIFKTDPSGFSLDGNMFPMPELNDDSRGASSVTTDKLYMQAVTQTMIMSMNQLQAAKLKHQNNPVALSEAVKDCQVAVRMADGLIVNPRVHDSYTMSTGDVSSLYKTVADVLTASMLQSYKHKLRMKVASGSLEISMNGSAGHKINTTLIRNMTDAIVFNANICATLYVTAKTPASDLLKGLDQLLQHYLTVRAAG